VLSDTPGGLTYSGNVLQPSAGPPETLTKVSQGGEVLRDTSTGSQYNPAAVNERPMEKDSFLPNGPAIISNEVTTSHLHHSTGSNPMYYVPQDKPAEKYTEPKMLPGQESQVKQTADNLGMGQTTFGANEPKYNVDLPPNTQYGGSTLHSVDTFQQQSSDIPRMKVLCINERVYLLHNACLARFTVRICSVEILAVGILRFP